MWIRSQDKTTLVNCTNFLMVYDNGNYIIKCFINKYSYFNLGFYSSEEKALKVLDMIEKHTNKENTYDILDTEDINKPYKITQSYNIVFQLLQDDEV